MDRADVVVSKRLRSVRRWTMFFIVGLFLSGATAIPIQTQLDLAATLMGEDTGQRDGPDFMVELELADPSPALLTERPRS